MTRARMARFIYQERSCQMRCTYLVIGPYLPSPTRAAGRGLAGGKLSLGGTLMSNA
jgi:hypothetical protein